MRFACVAALAASVLLLATASPASAGTPPTAARAEVLQAVVHPLASDAWTRQGFDQRCVLVEQHAEGTGQPAADGRAAVDGLLNNTTRRQMAYAEFGANDTRFSDYYRASLMPTLIFDGLDWISGGGPQAKVHAEAAYDEAERQAPRASINVLSSTVISTGFLDYEVVSPYNLTGYAVSVRGLIVEDNVSSAEAGRELRYFVRQYLAGDRIELTGNATVAGRLEFSLEASWVLTRLFAVVFVQVDAIPPAPLGNGAQPVDPFAGAIVPIAVLVTGTMLAVMIARFITAERRARLR